MSTEEYLGTAPKPFVFVLMPFAAEFDDIYEYGIKGGAEDAGAYAERIDEQMFVEGILDRIFNQINKADVIVADMTGRNPNVFYEVGYAHALNKVVLLLTQSADDIPFDLKHRPHIVYGGKITDLRPELAKRLTWAIKESRHREHIPSFRFVVSLEGADIPEISKGASAPTISVTMGPRDQSYVFVFSIRNDGPGDSEHVSYLYLFAEEESAFRPLGFHHTMGSIYTDDLRSLLGRAPIGISAGESDKTKLGLALQYQVDTYLPGSPPGAVQTLLCHAIPKNIERFIMGGKLESLPSGTSASFCLRLHVRSGVLDFPFRVALIRASAT